MGLDSNTPVYVDNLGTELLQVDATGKGYSGAPCG